MGTRAHFSKPKKPEEKKISVWQKINLGKKNKQKSERIFKAKSKFEKWKFGA
jgi:hypothetical protein